MIGTSQRYFVLNVVMVEIPELPLALKKGEERWKNALNHCPGRCEVSESSFSSGRAGISVLLPEDLVSTAIVAIDSQ